jgi:hypothetical protein
MAAKSEAFRKKPASVNRKEGICAANVHDSGSITTASTLADSLPRLKQWDKRRQATLSANDEMTHE